MRIHWWRYTCTIIDIGRVSFNKFLLSHSPVGPVNDDSVYYKHDQKRKKWEVGLHVC